MTINPGPNPIRPIDFEDLAQWDEDIMELTVAGHPRLILNTVHGQVTIDVRNTDVNAFIFVNGKRHDFVLLKAPDQTSESK